VMRRGRSAAALILLVAVVSIAPVASAAIATPSVSALGTSHRIVFSSDRSGGSEIFTADETGGDVRQITDVGPNAVAFQGTWSPDGSTIAYVRLPLGEGEPSIHIVGADGTGDHRLLRDPLFGEFEPEFSPDGGTILFDRCRPGRTCTLYTVRPDGTHLRQLIPFSVDGATIEAEYSSDGSRIAFGQFYDRAGQAAVYVASADGSGRDRITPWALEAYLPSWAPDDSSIVYASHCCDGRPGSLWIANPDGSDRRRLTDAGDRSDGTSTFSPTGDLIAFERYSPDFSRGAIWVVAPDGTGLRRLIPDAIEPEWQR
jgi:Tol biopolymer transport system component